MLRDYAYTSDGSPMNELSEEEYYDTFKKLDEKQLLKAYEQAWQAKNFEIDNYWKRANYFWLFQAAAFTGYFAVLGTSIYTNQPQSAYTIGCLGLITALAWLFTNKGSKTWQRHWEIHVDMLENNITGPLYKIVTESKTYSVSKINEIISAFSCWIWVVILITYVCEHDLNPWTSWKSLDYKIIASSILTLYFGSAMHWGYGRGRFGDREIKFYSRKFHHQLKAANTSIPTSQT